MTDMKLGAPARRDGHQEGHVGAHPGRPPAAAAQVAADAGEKLQDEIRKGGVDDVAAMKPRGLNVVPVDAQDARAVARRPPRALYPKIRGDFVPADAFDEALRYRDEYRKPKAGAKEMKALAIASQAGRAVASWWPRWRSATLLPLVDAGRAALAASTSRRRRSTSVT